MTIKRNVPFKIDRKDAKRLLSRLYADRYDDKDETPVYFEVGTEETIKCLEERFPLVTEEFDHNE